MVIVIVTVIVIVLVLVTVIVIIIVNLIKPHWKCNKKILFSKFINLVRFCN